MGRIVGIDLGTTNSLVAWHDGASPRVIPLREKEFLLASAVALDPSEGLILGRRAREGAALRPDTTILSIKRHMGTDRKFLFGGEEMSPQEVSALLLKELKRAAETHLEAPVDRAVISVPAYFTDPQRRATREAGELAGLRVERLISEPTAAALAYGLDRLDAEEYLLVYDLGGGTFDVTVLEMFEGIFSIRASSGENRLGGDDIDLRLSDWLLERARPRVERKRLTPEVLAALRMAAEEAKIELSSRDEAPVRLDPLPLLDGKAASISVPVRRADLDGLVVDLLDRTGACVLRALAEARVPKEKIAEVILVGGPTRMPAVREFLGKLFGKPPRHTVDPMQAVALGAAIQARLLDPGRKDAGPSDIVISDVCPFTLGISVLDEVGGQLRPGVFAPVIQRNAALPAKMAKVFSTCHPDQESVAIEVYQGDDALVENNVFLDRYYLGGFPVKTGRTESIEITFRYDEDGILKVDAVIQSTGKSAGIRIDPQKMRAVGHGIAPSRARVDSLWEDGRRSAALRDLIQAVEARLKEMPPEIQGQVAEKIQSARAALASNDRARIESLTRELSLWASKGNQDGG